MTGCVAENLIESFAFSRAALEALADDTSRFFDLTRLDRDNRPLSVGAVSGLVLAAADRRVAEGYVINALDMPVKLPGEDLLIPSTIPEWISGIVSFVVAFENEHVGDVAPWHVYLTVHQSMVSAGASQRNAGAHIDGFQGVAYPEPLAGCHAYLLASRAPTVFYPHAFRPRPFDADVDNLYRILDEQKDTAQAVIPEPGQLVLASCYCVHESPIVKTAGARTFVRIEFSKKRFDREGNTLNPLIDTSDWEYRPRPIPGHLH